MPERPGRALLHRINPPEVRPLFYAASVTTPPDVEGFAALCQAARAKPVGTVTLGRAAGIQPLPAHLANKEAQIRQTEQFKNFYEPFGASFVSLPVTDVLTPQWWVDVGYVDELAGSVPSNDADLFDYCFAEGRLDPPMLLGMNGAVIVSGRRDLGTISPLRIRAASSSKVTFEFDALPRPNWLWLNAVPQTGQVVILNGVHHLLALLRWGRDRAYCLLKQGPIDQAFNYGQEPGVFKPQQMLSARPPQLRDYLDESIADEVKVRAVDQFMRFGVQQPPEIGFVPQSDG